MEKLRLRLIVGRHSGRLDLTSRASVDQHADEDDAISVSSAPLPLASASPNVSSLSRNHGAHSPTSSRPASPSEGFIDLDMRDVKGVVANATESLGWARPVFGHAGLDDDEMSQASDMMLPGLGADAPVSVDFKLSHLPIEIFKIPSMFDYCE